MQTFIFHKEKYVAESVSSLVGEGCEIFDDPQQIVASLRNTCQTKSADHNLLLLISGDSMHDLEKILMNVFGTKKNRDPVIVFSQDDKESLVNSAPKPFKDILSECFQSKALGIIESPIRKETLDSAIQDAIAHYVNNEETCQELWKSIAYIKADEIDHSSRHRQLNLRAAKRLLHGALRSGYYNLLDPEVSQKARQCYEELLRSSIDTEKQNIADEIQLASDVIENAVNEFRSGTREIKSEVWHQRINKLLVIDDQVQMWEPVWRFILNGKAVVTTVDIDKSVQDPNALKIIQNLTEKKRFDCIILDIDLEGENRGSPDGTKKNGIEILQLIKYLHFDMPVIMMTAYDDTDLTKACMRYGASEYFVKEMEDEKDRNSIHYFDKLVEIISKCPLLDSEERQAWDKLQKVKDRIAFVDNKYKTTHIEAFLKKAYFYMTLDDDFFLPAKLLLTTKRGEKKKILRNKYFDATINIEIALNQICSVLYFEKQKGIISLAAAKERLFDTKVTVNKTGKKNTSQRAQTDAPPLTRYRSVSDILDEAGIKIDGINPLTNIFNDARHNNLGKINITDALFCFNQVLQICSGKFVTPLPQGAASIIAKPYELMTGNKPLRKLPHGDISALSAEILEKGFQQVKFKEVYPCRVLFIDDEGEISRWYSVLNKRFSKFHVVKDFQSFQVNLDDFDMILLDLNLMGNDYKEGCRTGLQTLTSIKDENFTVPVIMLTATNSSFYTKRALLRGAFDYFSKSVIYDPQNYYEQFDRLVKRVMNINREEKEMRDEYIKFKNLLATIVKSPKHKLHTYMDNIEKFLLAPIHSAYFHYILLSKKYNLPDINSLRYLISDNETENNFFFVCGNVVEGLMKISSNLHPIAKLDAGRLIQLYPTFPMKEKMEFIWKKRTSGKDAAVKSHDFTDYLLTTIKVARSGLLQVVSPTFVWKKDSTGNYNRR